jgi:hypothetical protein
MNCGRLCQTPGDGVAAEPEKLALFTLSALIFYFPHHLLGFFPRAIKSLFDDFRRQRFEVVEGDSPCLAKLKLRELEPSAHHQKGTDALCHGLGVWIPQLLAQALAQNPEHGILEMAFRNNRNDSLVNGQVSFLDGRFPLPQETTSLPVKVTGIKAKAKPGMLIPRKDQDIVILGLPNAVFQDPVDSLIQNDIFNWPEKVQEEKPQENGHHDSERVEEHARKSTSSGCGGIIRADHLIAILRPSFHGACSQIAPKVQAPADRFDPGIFS